MPTASSFPDFMAAWNRMITAVKKNQHLLPDLSGVVGPLEAILDEAKALDAAKAAAKAQLSQGAKRTRTLVPEGRAAAARLRGALIAHFGSHNEILREFDIVPVRRRRVPEQSDPSPPNPTVQVPKPE